MARNKVQFQKGLSDAKFEAVYRTGEKRRALRLTQRWMHAHERLE
jgi:hypothetical protein